MHIELPKRPEFPERVKLQPYQQDNSISAVAVLHTSQAEQ